MKWVDYREKLGIGISDKQKCEMIKNNILEFLPFLGDSFTDPDYLRYCLMVGERKNRNTGAPIYGLIESMENAKNAKLLLAKYIALYNSFDPEIVSYKASEREKTKNTILDFLEKSLSSLSIGYEMVRDSEGVFIFPKGAAELDDALVSEPLEWLTNYPKARKAFVTAIRQYSEEIYVRDVADNLRKALEAFLQEFLGNDKNLEKNKEEICRYLGGEKVDSAISGLFHPLISAYKTFNDKTAKHNDFVDPRLLEFLLYQTGVLIRMVISIKQSAKE